MNFVLFYKYVKDYPQGHTAQNVIGIVRFTMTASSAHSHGL